MTEVLEGVGVILSTTTQDKCPICEKPPHETTADKKENKGDLTSKPENLGCSPLVTLPGLPNYTTAAHHLIPANQCLKAFPRLSQMCNAVGYDVNNGQNGMSLPTVGQQEENVYGDAQVKYGKLKPEDKMKVAYLVMDGTNLEWHVGHHKWKALNMDTDNFPHPPNYDQLVKLKLRELERDIQTRGGEICDPNKAERGKDVITELNDESQRIKGKIEAWNKYFVSALSYEFAKEYR